MKRMTLCVALAAALGSPTRYDGLAANIADAFAGNALQTPQLRAQPASAQLPLFRSTGRQEAVPPSVPAPAAADADAIAIAGVPMDLNARLEQLSARIDALGDKIDAL